MSIDSYFLPINFQIICLIFSNNSFVKGKFSMFKAIFYLSFRYVYGTCYLLFHLFLYLWEYILVQNNRAFLVTFVTIIVFFFFFFLAATSVNAVKETCLRQFDISISNVQFVYKISWVQATVCRNNYGIMALRLSGRINCLPF